MRYKKVFVFLTILLISFYSKQFVFSLFATEKKEPEWKIWNQSVINIQPTNPLSPGCGLIITLHSDQETVGILINVLKVKIKITIATITREDDTLVSIQKIERDPRYPIFFVNAGMVIIKVQSPELKQQLENTINMSQCSK